MLDENFPTYRLQPSADEPLNTILYFTYNGSDPAPEYMLKRPSPSASKNQYALALFDVHYASVIYGEVLVEPEWTQPTLSAAEIRSQNGAAASIPVTPDAFPVLLYNPDQSIVVKRHAGGWNRSDYWGFEMPERSFKRPSASQLDRETGGNQVSELSPKMVFHWKRDGRLSKDMTCYMSGRSVGGKKSKEPDITVAMYRGGKHEGLVTIYEPNMARVEVEDRKGLEVVLLLSAVAVRDLYLAPKQDLFNVAGGTSSPAAAANGGRKNSRPTGGPPHEQLALASGALGDLPASSPPPLLGQPPVDIDAETRRLQAMVAEEERQHRERLAREEEERTRRMLEREAEQQRWQRQADVDRETERLRREYGVQAPGGGGGGGGGRTPSASTITTATSPALPPRPGSNMVPASMSGALVIPGPPPGGPPQRPNSVGPLPTAPQQQGRRKHSNPLGVFMSGPYSGPSSMGASVSNFFANRGSEEEKRKKIQKKRSVQF